MWAKQDEQKSEEVKEKRNKKKKEKKEAASKSCGRELGQVSVVWTYFEQIEWAYWILAGILSRWVSHCVAQKHKQKKTNKRGVKTRNEHRRKE